MKNAMKGHKMVVKLLSVGTLVFLSTILNAQDKGIDINVDLNKHDNWYQNPIVWVVGGAVFILLLVALLRGSKK
ncbi:MAG: hypothetical protein IPP15_05570 [Saprospiraceae bacterium]|uniref:Uncharacterized protein n=1 Tax=Candidatus Opimibacter skivensis TaxID=2982028 RepID=A0A9D7XSN1_9BACT|nr:hypothetical protein [Candidatus Opimibacter skivensis]